MTTARVGRGLVAIVAVLLVLGWAGEWLGDWAGTNPDRITIVLIVQTLVIILVLGAVLWLWTRYRRWMTSE